MLFAAILLLCFFAWIALALTRKLAHRRRRSSDRQEFSKLSKYIRQICELAKLTGRTYIIHRQLPGYCTMVVYPDYPAWLIERGVADGAGPPFNRFSAALQFWLGEKFYLVGLAPDALSIHAMHREDDIAVAGLIPVTHDRQDVHIAKSAVLAFHAYLGLPAALDAARQPKERAPLAPPPLPAREVRVYDIHPENRLAHIGDYVEDGDFRTFYDMFDSDEGHQIILWVDHRDDDADIVQNCERILQTGSLSAYWGGDRELDLIICFRGQGHAVRYPGGMADRDTSIVALGTILRPEFELRYCTASDGSDSSAFLPLTPDQWRELESRFHDRLDSLFVPVDDRFAKFG